MKKSVSPNRRNPKESHAEGGEESGPSAIKNRVNALDVSVKLAIIILQRNTKAALKLLNDNRKEVQLLRSECATLEHHATETTNDILKEIIEDIANLEKDYLKLQHSDINECNFLKQQAQVLVQEKIALQQDAIMLDSRITTIENDIGYE